MHNAYFQSVQQMHTFIYIYIHLLRYQENMVKSNNSESKWRVSKGSLYYFATFLQVSDFSKQFNKQTKLIYVFEMYKYKYQNNKENNYQNSGQCRLWKDGWACGERKLHGELLILQFLYPEVNVWTFLYNYFIFIYLFCILDFSWVGISQEEMVWWGIKNTFKEKSLYMLTKYYYKNKLFLLWNKFGGFC